MNFNNNSNLTLVERKKLQWNREKEEMKQLYIPWCLKTIPLTMNDLAERMIKYSNYKNDSSVLPQISKSRKIITEPESSGYVSEAINDSRHKKTSRLSTISNSSEEIDTAQNNEIFWSLNTFDKKYALPKWVQRRLKMSDGQILVVNNNSSPEYSSQAFSSESSSETNTYLLGQHSYIEPIEMLERERRRKQALEYQREIKKQVAENEQKRKEERERIINEEIKEEKRIEKQNEIESQRIEETKQALVDKQEKEKEKHERIQQAIKQAEEQAKWDKQQLRLAKVAPCASTLKIPVKESSRNSDIFDRKLVPKLQPEQHTLNSVLKSKEEINHLHNENDLSTPIINQNQQQVQQFTFLVPPIFLPNYNPDQQYVKYYSNNLHLKDAGTQTDVEKCISDKAKPSTAEMLGTLYEKLKSIERFQKNLIGYNNSNMEIITKTEAINDRPKWGSNRSLMKYIKQSDKDLNRKVIRKNLWSRNNIDDEYSCTTTSEDSLHDKQSKISNRFSRSNKNKPVGQRKFDQRQKIVMSKFRKGPNFEFLKRPEKQSCIDDLLVESLDRFDTLSLSEKDS